MLPLVLQIARHWACGRSSSQLRESAWDSGNDLAITLPGTACICVIVSTCHAGALQVQRLREHIQKKHPEEDVKEGDSQSQPNAPAPLPGPSSAPNQVLRESLNCR